MWWVVAAMAAKAVMGAGASMDVSKAQNKAAMAQMGKQLNELSMQRAQAIQQTSDALFNIDVAADKAQSQVQLQSAASGTMGASVKDAVSTINTNKDSNQANVYSQLDAKTDSISRQVLSVVDSTANNMDWESGSDKIWNGLLGSMGGMMGAASASGATSSTATDISTKIGDSASAAKDWAVDKWNNSGASETYSSWKSYLSN